MRNRLDPAVGGFSWWVVAAWCLYMSHVTAHYFSHAFLLCLLMSYITCNLPFVEPAKVCAWWLPLLDNSTSARWWAGLFWARCLRYNPWQIHGGTYIPHSRLVWCNVHCGIWWARKIRVSICSAGNSSVLTLHSALCSPCFVHTLIFCQKGRFLNALFPCFAGIT